MLLTDHLNLYNTAKFISAVESLQTFTTLTEKGRMDSKTLT